jgi:hypothetical protein
MYSWLQLCYEGKHLNSRTSWIKGQLLWLAFGRYQVRICEYVFETTIWLKDSIWHMIAGWTCKLMQWHVHVITSFTRIAYFVQSYKIVFKSNDALWIKPWPWWFLGKANHVEGKDITKTVNKGVRDSLFVPQVIFHIISIIYIYLRIHQHIRYFETFMVSIGEQYQHFNWWFQHLWIACTISSLYQPRVITALRGSSMEGMEGCVVLY